MDARPGARHTGQGRRAELTRPHRDRSGKAPTLRTVKGDALDAAASILDTLAAKLRDLLFDQPMIGVPLFLALGAATWCLGSMLDGLVRPLSSLLANIGAPAAFGLFGALAVLFTAGRLAAAALHLSHTRVSRRSGIVRKWMPVRAGRFSGASLVAGLAGAIVDAALLHLAVRAVAGLPIAWLGGGVAGTVEWGLAERVMFGAASCVGQFALVAGILWAVNGPLAALIYRGDAATVPYFIARRARARFVLAGVVEGFVYLPAIVGVAVVNPDNPFVPAVIQAFLCAKIVTTAMLEVLSLALDGANTDRLRRLGRQLGRGDDRAGQLAAAASLARMKWWAMPVEGDVARALDDPDPHVRDAAAEAHDRITAPVIVTETDGRYHHSDCPAAAGPVRQIDVLQAMLSGHTPCKRCTPPK